MYEDFTDCISLGKGKLGAFGREKIDPGMPPYSGNCDVVI